MCVMRSGEEVDFPSEPTPKAPAKQMLSAWAANAPREARAPDLEVDSLTLSRSNQLSYGSLWSTVAVSTPAWRAREDARRHVPVASQTRLSAKVCPKEPKTRPSVFRAPAPSVEECGKRDTDDPLKPRMALSCASTKVPRLWQKSRQ